MYYLLFLTVNLFTAFTAKQVYVWFSNKWYIFNVSLSGTLHKNYMNLQVAACSPHRHKSGKGGLHNKCVLSLIKVLCLDLPSEISLKLYAENLNEG